MLDILTKLLAYETKQQTASLTLLMLKAMLARVHNEVHLTIKLIFFNIRPYTNAAKLVDLFTLVTDKRAN